MSSRTTLQVAAALLALIPIGAGSYGLLFGPSAVDPSAAASIDLDSHFRYLSGLLLGIGLAFWSCIPRIERRKSRVRILTFIVFIGGLARLVGTFAHGMPDIHMQGALVMELIVTPLLCWWQNGIAIPKRSISAVKTRLDAPPETR